MRWKYCYYCLIDGACENQDRGHECEMPVKKLCKENQQLKELIKECRDEMNHYTELFTHKKTFEVLLTKIDEVLK